MSSLAWLAVLMIALAAIACWENPGSPSPCCDVHGRFNPKSCEVVYCPVRDQ